MEEEAASTWLVPNRGRSTDKWHAILVAPGNHRQPSLLPSPILRIYRQLQTAFTFSRRVAINVLFVAEAQRSLRSLHAR